MWHRAISCRHQHESAECSARRYGCLISGHHLISVLSLTAWLVRTSYKHVFIGLSQFVSVSVYFYIFVQFGLLSFCVLLANHLSFGKLVKYVKNFWNAELKLSSISMWARLLIYVSCRPEVACVLVKSMINTSVSQGCQYLVVTQCHDFWHLGSMSNMLFSPQKFIPYSSPFSLLQLIWLLLPPPSPNFSFSPYFLSFIYLSLTGHILCDGLAIYPGWTPDIGLHLRSLSQTLKDKQYR